MQTVMFYLLPIKAYCDFDYESAKELKNMLSDIQRNNDVLWIPLSFLNPDRDGNTVYGKNQNSAQKLLVQIIGKCKYADIQIDSIDVNDYHNCFIKLDRSDSEEQKAIHTGEELLKYYQESAYCLETFPELFDWKERCFPKLLFTDDSFGRNHDAFREASQPEYSQLLSQSIQCLTVLNNRANAFHAMEIRVALPEMQAALPGIRCTGKGGNETQKYKKKIVVNEKDLRKEYNISCHPHFKLIRGDSNYRIYFSWGNEEIKESTFIVVKLGNHWNDTDDSIISEIIM